MDSVPPGGSTAISGNAVGCENVATIRTACAPTVIDGVTITADGQVPDNVTAVTRITGDLSISGTITTFPNFAALAVVQGNLTIDATSLRGR